MLPLFLIIVWRLMEATMKKLIRFLISMKFAIAILFLLGILSIGGTLIAQNMPKEFYLANYGEFGNIIWMLGLHRTYTSWWYITIVILLCISLLLCVVFRFKPIIALFKKGGIKIASEKAGSWLLHTGILLTILFFSLGSIFAFQSSIYNVANTSTIPEGTGLNVEIKSFDIILRPDETVDTYKTYAKIYDEKTNELLSEGAIEVNHPLVVRGYQFSQASFGFAVDAQIKKDGKNIGEAVLFDDEYVVADEDKIYIQMNELYPNVEVRYDGLYNASQKLQNPMVEYTVYFLGRVVKQDIIAVETEFEIMDYKVTFTNARHFPILDIRKDPFAIWTGVGAIMLLLGIFVVFYGPKKENPILNDDKQENLIIEE